MPIESRLLSLFQAGTFATSSRGNIAAWVAFIREGRMEYPPSSPSLQYILDELTRKQMAFTLEWNPSKSTFLLSVLVANPADQAIDWVLQSSPGDPVIAMATVAENSLILQERQLPTPHWTFTVVRLAAPTRLKATDLESAKAEALAFSRDHVRGILDSLG